MSKEPDADRRADTTQNQKLVADNQRRQNNQRDAADQNRHARRHASDDKFQRRIKDGGKAEQEQYVLDKTRINIGRMAELTDSEQRVIRRNHIVFQEGADEANATVSRGHAHVRQQDGEYRICDDESEYGTRVFRDGRGIEAPAGNRRGELLRPGDEIYLGRACLRFER